MRKWKWLGFAAMAILMSMNLVSCSQENDAVLPEQPTEEYVTVNLGVTGEYLELSESPLRTRAEGELRDLIGIQVYSKESHGEGPFYLYAHGEFTSLENVSIKLLQDQKYKFETAVIVDGCSCTGEGIEFNGCHVCRGWGDGIRSNGTTFTYTSNNSLSLYLYILDV